MHTYYQALLTNHHLESVIARLRALALSRRYDFDAFLRIDINGFKIITCSPGNTLEDRIKGWYRIEVRGGDFLSATLIS